MSTLVSFFKDQNIIDVLKNAIHGQQRQGTIARSMTILSLAVAIATYAVHRMRLYSVKEHGVPLVPYVLPFIGSSPEYRKDPKAFLDKWTAKFGPVFRAHIFGRVHTIISGLYVREVFLNDDFSFEVGMGKTFDGWLITDTKKSELFNTPLVRSVVMKHLAVDVKNYTPRAVEHLAIAAHEMLDNMAESKELPHLYPLVQNMVARAIASILVGLKLCKDKELLETFKNVAVDIGSELNPDNYLYEAFPTISRLRQWYLGKYGKAINKHQEHMLRVLGPEIDERLAAMERGDDEWERPEDILQGVLETAKLTSDHPQRYMMPIKWFLILVFASIHTTSQNTTVTMYRLLQDPKVIDELLEEQNQVFEKHHGSNYDDHDITKLLTGEVIKDLVKLDSVCREAMRFSSFYAELPHTYIGKSPLTMSNGAIINPGDDVLINGYANHHDPDIQIDGGGDYAEFKPFRFVEKGRQSTRIGDDYLIFGQGKHACPGRWFAMQEMKTTISFLIQQYIITAKGDITFLKGHRQKIPMGQVIFQRRQ